MSGLADREMADTKTLVKAAKKRAGERDRTADLPFTRRLLCQLSYTGWVVLMVAETSTAAPDGNPRAAACACTEIHPDKSTDRLRLR
jgi:hypothetical protein